jgi:O-succinylhomoserine sulfhydrylase
LKTVHASLNFADEKDRNIYSRYSNPNTNEFCREVCKMEGAASGFAFIRYGSSVFDFGLLLNSGDHIVSASSIFGATHFYLLIIFLNGGIETRILTHEPGYHRKFYQTKHQNSFCESPTNPAVDIIDLELLKAYC